MTREILKRCCYLLNNVVQLLAGTKLKRIKYLKQKTIMIMLDARMAAEKTPRRHTGARMSVAIYERIEAVAKKQKTSPRAVLEQLAEAGLPDLERFFGIKPARPKKPESDQSSGQIDG